MIHILWACLFADDRCGLPCGTYLRHANYKGGEGLKESDGIYLVCKIPSMMDHTNLFIYHIEVLTNFRRHHFLMISIHWWVTLGWTPTVRGVGGIFFRISFHWWATFGWLSNLWLAPTCLGICMVVPIKAFLIIYTVHMKGSVGSYPARPLCWWAFQNRALLYP